MRGGRARHEHTCARASAAMINRVRTRSAPLVMEAGTAGGGGAARGGGTAGGGGSRRVVVKTMGRCVRRWRDGHAFSIYYTIRRERAHGVCACVTAVVVVF